MYPNIRMEVKHLCCPLSKYKVVFSSNVSELLLPPLQTSMENLIHQPKGLNKILMFLFFPFFWCEHGQVRIARRSAEGYIIRYDIFCTLTVVAMTTIPVCQT